MADIENCDRSRRLIEAVLSEDEIFSLIASWATQGSLQIMSMTNKSWLGKAYLLGHETWAAVDMATWPFAAKERRQEKKRAKFAIRLKEMERRWNKRCARGLRPFSDEDWTSDSGSDFHPVSYVPGGLRKWQLKDAKVHDYDLINAVRRIPVGMLRCLSVCSSNITIAGVCEALRVHSAKLLELCLNDCGSGNLTGLQLQAALDGCTALRVLELRGVQASPPTGAIGLQELLLGHRVPALSSEMIHQFPDLRVLCISNVWPQAFLLELFRSSSELRDINIINSECQVTNEMLAYLMRHTPRLAKFSGYRNGLGVSHEHRHVERFVMFPFADGEQSILSRGLDPDAVEAFKNHFVDADIFVDWPAREDLLAAMEELMADG